MVFGGEVSQNCKDLQNVSSSIQKSDKKVIPGVLLKIRVFHTIGEQARHEEKEQRLNRAACTIQRMWRSHNTVKGGKKEDDGKKKKGKGGKKK